MLRSKSLDFLPTSSTAGEDVVWSEDATRQAMLDIVLSDGTPSIFESSHINLGPLECPRSSRGRTDMEMWSYREPPSGANTERRICNIGHIATPGRTGIFKPSRSGTVVNTTTDVDAKKEKDYITRSNLPLYPRGPFNKMIIQTFYKAPKSESVGYGMPRPFTREGSMHQNAIKSLSIKAPSYIKINTHRKLCTPDPCSFHDGHSGQYCDILGPGACSRCIESTNRHIADVIQKKMFPAIEVSNNCLVAPKLSKALKEGHVKQIRRQRLQELNLPQTLCGPERQSEQITWSTLHPKSSSSKMSTCGSLPYLSSSEATTFSGKSICFD